MKSKYSTHVSAEVQGSTVRCFLPVSTALKVLAKQRAHAVAPLRQPLIYSHHDAAVEDLKNNCNDQ